MSDIDPELHRLQDLLETIPSDWKGMNVVELDGYVAGLIVCPDTVPPDEWLPGVRGSNVGFEDAEGTEPTIAAVKEHYRRIARKSAERPEDYAPILGVDTDSGEEIWEPWVGGFERAMRLRRAVWRRIARSNDREASASLNMMIALSDSSRGRSDLTDEGEEELRGLAPELIPDLVCKLHAWRKSCEAANAAPDRQNGSQDTGDEEELLPLRNTEGHTEGHTWDTDAMIHNARSLHAVARYLVSDPDPGETPTSDVDGLFGTGRFFAGPVLLALAIEIALKAWHCQETKGPPRRAHDLIALFEALSENTQRLLVARYPSDLFPRATDVFGPLPSDMRSALEIHRKTFEIWRYPHEDPDDVIWPDALDAALSAIVDAYDHPSE
ncbi:MAG: UPF0149 family protein [Chloroflexi bacterium]|nr:UPF0149 family protein [Chloroflexota bacterium]